MEDLKEFSYFGSNILSEVTISQLLEKLREGLLSYPRPSLFPGWSRGI
jgi:hypothetical protein